MEDKLIESLNIDVRKKELIEKIKRDPKKYGLTFSSYKVLMM